MNKPIVFFLLLIANTITYGMKRENPNNNCLTLSDEPATTILCHIDLIPQITTAICIKNGYRPCGIRTDIRALSDTNKFLHNYYAQEKVQQSIIDLCIPHNNSNTRNIARGLKCRTMYAKIKRFTNIVL